MDYSTFVILLARQRSGTHALGAFLETHPEVFYIDEIFHLDDAERPGTGETNFFAFVKKEAGQDPLKLIPVDHEALFLKYLAYLRGFTAKRYIVLDVKYNSAHLLLRNYKSLASPPYLFDLILKHGMRTFALKRKNYLRYLVSITKAAANGRFGVRVFDPPAADEKTRIYIPTLLHELAQCRAEDELVDRGFGEYARHTGYNYDGKLFTSDYADLFPATEAGLAAEFLQRFSSWLGIANDFRQECRFKKQSSMPLAETIENYQEVVCALRGTAFEYCLSDEPFYAGGRGEDPVPNGEQSSARAPTAGVWQKHSIPGLAMVLNELLNTAL